MLSETQAHNANMQDSKLQEADFSNAIFKEANLNNALCVKTVFRQVRRKEGVGALESLFFMWTDSVTMNSFVV